MANDIMTVRIDGEPFLSRAQKHKEAFYLAGKAWLDFAKERGGIPSNNFGCGLYFEDKPPEGWTKRDRKGWSSPKKTHADWKTIRDLPRPLDAGEIFEPEVPSILNYRTPDGEGSCIIGPYWRPVLGWFGDRFYCHLGDPAAARDRRVEQGCVVEEPVAGWVLPEGLTRLSDAEYQFELAAFNLEEEKKSAEQDS